MGLPSPFLVNPNSITADVVFKPIHHSEEGERSDDFIRLEFEGDSYLNHILALHVAEEFSGSSAAIQHVSRVVLTCSQRRKEGLLMLAPNNTTGNLRSMERQ